MRYLLCLLFCFNAMAQSPYEKERAEARVEWAESEQSHWESGVTVAALGSNNTILTYSITIDQDWTSASIDTYLTTSNIIRMRNMGYKQMAFVDRIKGKGKYRLFAMFDLDPKKHKK